jgi:hypothetical protein
MRCTATVWRTIVIASVRVAGRSGRRAHLRDQQYRCTEPYGHEGDHRATIDPERSHP